MTKGPSFETIPEVLTWLLTLRPRMTHICGFLDTYSYSHILSYFMLLSDYRTKLVEL